MNAQIYPVLLSTLFSTQRLLSFFLSLQRSPGIQQGPTQLEQQHQPPLEMQEFIFPFFSYPYDSLLMSDSRHTYILIHRSIRQAEITASYMSVSAPVLVWRGAGTSRGTSAS
jgi:hypothetical protein